MKTNTKEWMDRKPYEISSSKFENWTITPDRAKELLETTVRNRTVRRMDVERYARDMMGGNWHKETSCISIDEDGHLVDGQHRLNAVILADMPIEFTVQLNVPPDTPFDTGIKRTAADNALMSGELAPELANKKLFAIINQTLVNVFGGTKAREYTDADKIKLMQKFGDEIAEAFDIATHGSKNPAGKNSAVQCGIFSALHYGIPVDILRRFAGVANSGFTSSESEWSAVVLFKMLADMKGVSGYGARMMRTAATEQAIRDFVREKPRQRAYSDYSMPYTEKISQEIKEVLE